MRTTTLLALALLAPLLAACDGGTPPAKPAAEVSAPAKAPDTPAKVPAAPAKVKLPAGAQPLLGSWSADLAACGDAGSVTVITATALKSAARSCDISLAANKDGSFSTTCGNEKLNLMPVFAPTGEGINLVVGEGKRQTLLRCTR